MNSVINELTPPQRALLHSALLYMKNNIKQEFADIVLNGESDLYREFYTYTEKQITELINQLFAHCFIEDMEFIQHFKAAYKAKKELEKQMLPTATHKHFEG
jgi:hypothetical protein